MELPEALKSRSARLMFMAEPRFRVHMGADMVGSAKNSIVRKCILKRYL